MEDARFWVKVSGSERISREGPPFHDAARYGRLLVERFPDRVLWGTDWPHPNISKNMPDDGALVDLLEVIAPRPRQRHALLVEIGRAHVCTPVTNEQLVCRLLLEKKKHKQ